MARPILTRKGHWITRLLLAAALFSPSVLAVPTPCPARKQELRALQEQVMAGAFYKDLSSRFGNPLSCLAEVQQEKTTLTYTFPGDAQLIATIAPKIESSEQTIKLVHLETDVAIALLKRAETDAYPPDGCGISWTQGEQESTAGSREMVYRGDTCNCQARLIYKGAYVVTLVLRSAC